MTLIALAAEFAQSDLAGDDRRGDVVGQQWRIRCAERTPTASTRSTAASQIDYNGPSGITEISASHRRIDAWPVRRRSPIDVDGNDVLDCSFAASASEPQRVRECCR